MMPGQKRFTLQFTLCQLTNLRVSAQLVHWTKLLNESVELNRAKLAVVLWNWQTSLRSLVLFAHEIHCLLAGGRSWVDPIHLYDRPERPEQWSVCRIGILESNPARFWIFLDMDWMSFSFQPDPDYPSKIKSGRARNVGM